MMDPQPWPLAWPEGRPRTPVGARKTSRFDVSHNAACANLFAQIRQLGGGRAVITSNMELRKDGMPFVRQNIADMGVAVYFRHMGCWVCFACDRWDRLACNIHAIAKTIEAIRGIARWGTGDMLDVAIQGFVALPPPVPVSKWWDVLGVQQSAPIEVIEASYRALAKKAHPDAGGTAEAWSELDAAIGEARKAVG
jgi:hypothetical protein